MKDTPGWFDFADFYNYIGNYFESGIFVEIGTWKGLSIKYLAGRVKNKNIQIVGIDTFQGTAGEHDDDIDVINGTLYQTYLKNIQPYSIRTIIGRSDETYINFEDNSIDFVFIDADHHYQSVKKDIELWYPKVRTGGIISGHDYAYGGECGVIPAVNEAFPDVKIYSGSVWYKVK